MKKILVLALLLLAFNAKSQTKDETEKWLQEKLFAFAYNASTNVYQYYVKTVEVKDCNIIVSATYLNAGDNFQSVRNVIDIIPVTSVLTYLKDTDTYVFKGKIKRRYEKEFEEQSSSWFELKNVPDDMLERIKKALGHYKKLCGAQDEPF